jgi:hypothetical protein
MSALGYLVRSTLGHLVDRIPAQQAGDFGTLDKKTGKLTVEGNIYTHPEIKDIAKEFGEVRGPVIDHYQIQSYQMDGIDVNANANL